MTIGIRPATPDDAHDIAAVHVGSFLATYPHFPTTSRSAAGGLSRRVAGWTRRLQRPEPGCSTLVATEEANIRGFVHFGISPDDDNGRTGHVFSIHVSPEATGRGIGGRLIGEAVASFGARGFRGVTLWVVAGNRDARRFYESHGWQEEQARRRETLAVDDEEGDEVEVVRYRLDIGESVKSRPPENESNDGAVPKYYELRQWLRQHIDGLPPGTPVPPERTLSEQFRMSRTTVRQALHDLAVEGRIVRMQGRGTFVAPPKVTQNLQLTSYTQDMLAQGLRPGARLIDVTVAEAEVDVAVNLGLAVGDPVTRVERVRYANGEAMAVETVYLSQDRFSGIGDKLADDVSLYAVLESEYGVIPAHAEETIETVLAPPAASRLLGTDATTPMLMLTRSSSDAEGRPVEYVRSLYRGDRFRLATTITRPAGRYIQAPAEVTQERKPDLR